MDQRVDNERRSDSEQRIDIPPREIMSAFDEATKKSWRNKLRKRRGLVMMITISAALALGLIVAWWLNARHY